MRQRAVRLKPDSHGGNPAEAGLYSGNPAEAGLHRLLELLRELLPFGADFVDQLGVPGELLS
jgi:hypothetical protein